MNYQKEEIKKKFCSKLHQKEFLKPRNKLNQGGERPIL